MIYESSLVFWHFTNFNTFGKDTTYVFVTPPPTSNPWVCVMTIPWALSVWWRREYAAIYVSHYSQLTLVFFCSLNVYPFHVALCLYTNTPCFPYMNLRVKNIHLVLPTFICSPTLWNILTTSVWVSCTQTGLWIYMQPLTPGIHVNIFDIQSVL